MGWESAKAWCTARNRTLPNLAEICGSDASYGSECKNIKGIAPSTISGLQGEYFWTSDELSRIADPLATTDYPSTYIIAVGGTSINRCGRYEYYPPNRTYALCK